METCIHKIWYYSTWYSIAWWIANSVFNWYDFFGKLLSARSISGFLIFRPKYYYCFLFFCIRPISLCQILTPHVILSIFYKLLRCKNLIFICLPKGSQIKFAASDLKASGLVSLQERVDFKLGTPSPQALLTTLCSSGCLCPRPHNSCIDRLSEYWGESDKGWDFRQERPGHQGRYWWRDKRRSTWKWGGGIG